ncbi:MAG: aminotransferase class I/II-fold pyridoxal phosphate-dependent enzyme [Candidatus Omnitrophica bacterium]|nr:aminotransferase class I/II-fold pyridoxal phosphate-dependent enzyme [Candidatus Omnitrophota bacterium]
MTYEPAQRMTKFPPYLFAEIDDQKSALKAKGIDFVDVSIGDPDIPAPDAAVEALFRSAQKKESQKYASNRSKLVLREKISQWSKRRFGITLSPRDEILPLIGSKEGLVHFPLAVVNSGDYVLIPSPGYPGYRGAALFSEGIPYELPLREENDFLPDLEEIPGEVRNKTKLMFLNYPHNPTTALAPRDFLERLIAFCAKYGIILAYDNAYSEIFYDEKPLSILEIPGAKEIAVEFHSCSKTFCMTGFRIGWAAGNPQLVSALAKVKSNTDSGIFPAVQDAAAAALDDARYIEQLRAAFRRRRDSFLETLGSGVFPRTHAHSTFYVWAALPEDRQNSIEYARYLLEKKHLVATPGRGFGQYGEGFIRFALTVDVPVLTRAAELLRSA